MQQPGFLQQQRQFQHVGHAIGFRDDAVRHRTLAVGQLRAAGAAIDRQFGAGFFAVFEVRRSQRPGRADFVDQQRDALLLIERQIAGAGLGRYQQFGHHPFMHVGVLAQVDRRQIEAEDPHRAPQVAQPAACQGRRAMLQ